MKPDSSMVCLLRMDCLYYATLIEYSIFRTFAVNIKAIPTENIYYYLRVVVLTHKMSKSYCIFLISCEQKQPSTSLELLSFQLLMRYVES